MYSQTTTDWQTTGCHVAFQWCARIRLVTHAMANRFVIESDSLVFPAFTLLTCILQTALCNSHAFLFPPNKQRAECLIRPQTKSTCASIRAEPGPQILAAVCLVSTFFARVMSDCPPSETLCHFAPHTLVSARGVEYWAVFLLVVTGSPRRAVADNSWSHWFCCLFC